MVEEWVTVTEEFLQSGASKAGGWNHEQLEAIGVPLPLEKGWKYRLMGRRIPAAKAKQFLDLKDTHLPHRGHGKPERMTQQTMF